jgi:hypothetical protein
MLATLAKVATGFATLKTPVTVVKGGNYTKTLSDLQKVSVYKELLENSTNIKSYLLKDINELTALQWFLENDFRLENLETMLSLKERMYEKMSSFSKEDITNTLNEPTYYSAEVLYLALYMYRLKRQHNIATTNTSVAKLFSEIENCDVLFNHFMEVDETLLVNLFNLKNFVITAENFEETLLNLNNPEYRALVHYITEYTKISDKELEKVEDLKRVKNLLNKIYLLKLRGTKYPEYNIKRVIYLASETNFDTKLLQGFYNNVDETFFEGKMDDLCYLNVSLNGKFHNLIETISRNNVVTKMLVYALKNKKYAFLRLLEENIETVNESFARSTNCLLLNSNTYENLINLNEINKDDLFELLRLPSKNYAILNDNSLCKVTPKELIALAKSPVSGICNLYAYLDCRIDTKLLILRQLAYVDYSFTHMNVETIKKIATKLVEKNLSNRMKEYNASAVNILNILSLPEEYDAMISQATSELELEFIYRNRETINLEVSLEENLNKFLENDVDCKKMFEVMNLSDSFIKEHEKTIREFCLLGNASIVMTYYGNQTGSQRENILIVAKAEMAGEMKRFKFHDLSKEIEFELSEKDTNVWVENTNKAKGDIFVYETYSFNDTMLIGEKPGHTCMNYKDGSYNECLLANFDSNKKIIFVKLNGTIVGRAIIRLTKSLNSDEIINKKVSFLDVENGDTTSRNDCTAKLTIFVERPYFAHVNDSQKKTIKKMICEMIKNKANEMNARFLASNDYYDCDLEQTKMNVFVSHTKNGVQYMDSFQGSNGVGNEASYKPCTCYA